MSRRVDRSACVQAPQLVAIAPGYTTHARMPYGLPSAASAWVRPVKPNFDAQYAAAENGN
jgi:hypothetical protein